MSESACGSAGGGCRRAGFRNVSAGTAVTTAGASVETLDALNEEGLSENIAPEICGLIAEQWPFPLYDIAMDQTGRDDKTRLLEIQDNWAPPI